MKQIQFESVKIYELDRKRQLGHRPPTAPSGSTTISLINFAPSLEGGKVYTPATSVTNTATIWAATAVC